MYGITISSKQVSSDAETVLYDLSRDGYRISSEGFQLKNEETSNWKMKWAGDGDIINLHVQDQ